MHVADTLGHPSAYDTHLNNFSAEERPSELQPLGIRGKTHSQQQRQHDSRLGTNLLLFGTKNANISNSIVRLNTLRISLSERCTLHAHVHISVAMGRISALLSYGLSAIAFSGAQGPNVYRQHECQQTALVRQHNGTLQPE